jgi:GH24 family phage-related lysozyme (muramidase)
MTRDHLNASLKLWQEREARFRRNWKSKRKGDPRRVYWFRLLKHAITMADRRQDQLHQLGTVGVSAAGVELVKRFEGFRSKPYLDRDYFPTVKALPTFSVLTQHQVDALTSFIYNVGPAGIGSGTSVGQALRRRDWRAAADHLLGWDRAGGFVLPGLKTRREAERALFLKP